MKTQYGLELINATIIGLEHVLEIMRTVGRNEIRTEIVELLEKSKQIKVDHYPSKKRRKSL